MMRRTLAVVAMSLMAVSVAGADERPRWDWVLGEEVDVDALVVQRLDYLGLDAFDVSAEQVAALRKGGTRVWCYLSAGTVEDWRPDLDAYLAADTAAGGRLIGDAYGDWPGERWLNIRELDTLMPLIEARLARCAAKGFDMVEFDNLDGYLNETGFTLTAKDALAFARALAEAARAAGLSPILKNVPDLAAELEPRFDAYLMEECVLWEFCDAARPFNAAGKPVFDVEYPEAYAEDGVAFDLDAVCAAGANGDIAVLVKTLDLTMQTTGCP